MPRPFDEILSGCRSQIADLLTSARRQMETGVPGLHTFGHGFFEGDLAMLRILPLVLLLAAAFASDVQAGGGCCPGCGCHNLKKVCKPVGDVKKETKFVYSCVCEDFCVPGPSRIVGHTCRKDCQGCEHCCPVRQPTCAAVRTRTKLIKTAVEVEKPTIKWVVQTVCCQCGTVCGPGSCANGCADGSCTGACASGAPAAPHEAPAAPVGPPMPPAPSPMKEAAYQPPSSSLIDVLTGEQR